MSLGLHRDTVELLRLMGAPDGYVARQFERHALLGGLRGGLLGFAAAILTVLALVYGSRLFELMSSLPLALRPADWVMLACVPIVAALLITAVARLTALWSLSRTA
jgi:cell division transport system permease protein